MRFNHLTCFLIYYAIKRIKIIINLNNKIFLDFYKIIIIISQIFIRLLFYFKFYFEKYL
jgi:hypothetical protein